MVRQVARLLCAALLLSSLASPATAQAPESPTIVFVRPCAQEPLPECGLWVVDHDGTRRQLTSSPDDRGPSWSPDGTLIAFVRHGDGLYTITPDGSGLRRIAEGVVAGAPHEPSARPSWSPDSRHLAATLGSADGGSPRLLVVHRDGGGRRVLAEGVFNPSWSPDGTRIAVMSSKAALLAIYDLSGNQLATSPGPRPQYEGDYWASAGVPSWSPDSTRLLFTAQQFTGRHAGWGGYVVGASGGTPRFVAAAFSNGQAWAPEGHRLVVWYLNVYDIAVDVGQLTEMAPDHTGDWVQDRLFDVAGWFEAEPVWLDDGRRVAHGRISEDNHRMQIVLAGAGDARVLAEVAFPNVGFAQGAMDFDVAPQVVRHAGPSRGETAAAVSRAVRDHADTVIIAPAGSYAEALLAAPLAGLHDAPVLLAMDFGLQIETAEEIRRLGARRAIVVDPTRRLDQSLELQLRERGGVEEVEWLTGENVFAAAATVAERLPGAHAYLVEGVTADPARGWPDAVSVSALAAHQETPVLYTLRDSLPAQTLEALRDRERVTIVGGTAAVSARVEQELIDLGLEVDRLSGADRYATSAAVADASVGAGLSAQRPWIVTATDFPDALAAGPAAAKAGAALLLAHGGDLVHSLPSVQWLAERAPRGAVLVGGPAAISRYVGVQVGQQLR